MNEEQMKQLQALLASLTPATPPVETPEPAKQPVPTPAPAPVQAPAPDYQKQIADLKAELDATKQTLKKVQTSGSKPNKNEKIEKLFGLVK